MIGTSHCRWANGSLPALLGATRAVEVRHQGRIARRLERQQATRRVADTDRAEVVDDLAHQAGLVLKNVA